MPNCKNDPETYYKGTEPSPKGKGYCAHAETEGSKKRGLDGSAWVVVKTVNDVKRWSKVKPAAPKKSSERSVKSSGRPARMAPPSTTKKTATKKAATKKAATKKAAPKKAATKKAAPRTKKG